MLKFNRKFKKLIIPVGINPNYNIDSSTLYNTSDATATANDIISGKVSYSGDGKVIGTLDIDDLIEESYNEGVNEQKSKLTTITITENGTYNREDGYNEVIVEVPDINGSYDEGYNDGVVAGREEIISEQSDATITPQTVFKGEIGYGANNEKIVGEFEFVEGFDFGVIGYSQAESNELNNDTAEKLAYSKSLYDAWDPNRTSANRYFQYDSSLVYAPNVNTINVTDMSYMLYQCPNLSIIPDYNYDKVTNMQNFCSYSGNKSLNLDLKSCNDAQMIASYNKSIEDVSINFNDTSTNCYGLFYDCDNLKNATLKNVNMTDSRSVFDGCSKLTTIILENVKLDNNIDSFFSGCSNLTSVPLFDTSNVTNIRNMFYRCSNLTSIPELDFSKVSLLDMFSTYTYYDILTSLGGFINAGKGITGTSTAQFYLKRCSVLSYDSVMNVINKAYDMTTKTDWTGSAEIALHSNVYSLLSSDDIAIATNKGWIITT